ncbi:DUF2189 domain-containing protein [Alphaproteobacteria bacterium GH1-50]|uniref:DUF2189 domain-containing protein n=1 Tax=Kangsaoukella pontilimi TaxID=2691042 RepID=A0A7C9MIM6_9RHOB|nr:DUF2189 domain-containing protein [Kangsaoukella pontilimi]MXQ07055.1 DUF2189 domain-containing protein [Kangsaoukella pontilimi]
METAPIAPSPRPEIGRLTFVEIWASLKAGLWDFRRAPLYGFAFSAFYVLVGLVLWWIGADTFLWTLALSLGFPLVAPFAAVGLYEVSRRIEADEPLVWSEVMAVVWQERRRQLPWIGVVLLLIFLFWSFFAHMSFALFLGSSTLTNISTSYEVFLTPAGLSMLAFQVVVGAGVAFLTFGLTVVALPLLVDKEFDFVTAMLISLNTVSRNKGPMIVWAAIVALTLFAAMIPAFLGLLVALPVLGHATWHLYRRALYHPM